MTDLLKTPRGLADDPARARRRRRPDRPRRGDPRRRLRRPAPGHPQPRRDRDDRHDLRSRACAGAAGRASRPAPSGGPPPTTDAPRRYVVANGYGADPATGTDRFLLERDPFAVIEGAAIAAFAIGASEVIVAVRADATEAIRRLEAAIGAAEEAGFVGFDVLGSGHDIEVTVRPGPGRVHAGRGDRPAQGPRGQARPARAAAAAPGRARPVRPADRRPQRPDARGRALDHPQRRRRVRGDRHPRPAPARSSSRSGRRPATASPRSRSGRRCARSSALRGRLPAGRSLKAILVGGPSGGLLPPDLLDTPYDFEPLRAAGAHVGSGSVVVADDRACVVDLARLLTRFCAGEACGKTIPCRIGTRRLVEIADRVVDGRPRPTDMAAPDRPVRRHRGLRPVRPRAPDDPPAGQRDAILPVRAGRPHRSKRLPSRRLPPDRGGRRCDLIRRPWPT